MSAGQRHGRGGQYRHQDGQALFTPGPNCDPHAQWRWESRAPADWDDEAVRAVWAAAVEVDVPWTAGEAYERYHPDSGMVLVAEYGFIQTCYQLSDRPADEQAIVRAQLQERDP